MINDSAGVEIPLNDKSERTSTAMGFRSAAVIEADRGLCGKPVLISSAKDYERVFGSPSISKFGMAATEAYFLAQNNVPQVIVRALNPAMESNAQPFATIQFECNGDGSALDANVFGISNRIQRPADENKAYFYFKGEGNYAHGVPSPLASPTPNTSNIVLRFSKPTEESAYADEKRVMRLQVFDFAGAKHIDTDQEGKLLFNPALSDVVDGAGDFSGPLSELLGIPGTATVVSYNVTAYVNGRPGVSEFDSSASGSGSASSTDLWAAIGEAIQNAKKRGSDESVIPAEGWELDENSQVTGSTDKFIRTLLPADITKRINAFELSVSLAITVELSFLSNDDVKIPSAYLNVDSGTVNVRANTASEPGSSLVYGPSRVTATLSTSAVLIDRSNYMFMGAGNAYWAAYYEGFRKETWDFSFSYDDYDANYNSMQADAVLKASNYIVCSSNDVFGDYAIDWDSAFGSLVYFQGNPTSNAIAPASKSYAYSQALITLLQDNLTRWRCVSTPNLGDVMIKGDYIAAIESAGESTFGVSNIGKAASVDVFAALEGGSDGRHGNRFISDFSVYGYRSLNGRRTPFTFACLVTELLNRNFRNGNEARPPFGPNYGQVICDEITQEFTGPERLMLARQWKVNPVMEDGGFYLWDERTSQAKETSLSDSHSILSFIWMKFMLFDTMKSFVAEYNDPETVTRGLSLLEKLALTFRNKKYVEEAKADAKTNVIGDETMRFRFGVRFKGAARYVVVEVTAYSQTQSLAISMAQELEEM